MQRRVDQRIDAVSDLLLIDSRINQLQARVFQLNGAKRDAQLNLLQTVGYRADVQETLSCRVVLMRLPWLNLQWNSQQILPQQKRAHAVLRRNSVR